MLALLLTVSPRGSGQTAPAAAPAASGPRFQGPAMGIGGTPAMVSFSAVPQVVRGASIGAPVESSHEHEIPRVKNPSKTGGMRRLHLRDRTNVLKRYQVHIAALNLGIVLRSLIGLGTPRGFQGRNALLVHALSSLLSSMRDLIHSLFNQVGSFSLNPRDARPLRSLQTARRRVTQ